jgi:glucose-1-phosphate cytidylyltransferase
MKAVILAGGLGSRLSEETHLKPKPMVEIGGRPIIWHIMKIYSACGIHDFIICAGYKGYLFKEYFANYAMHQSDVTFDLREKLIEFHNNPSEPWRVTIVDTGVETMTGGRLKRVQPFIGNERFCLTYGDGLTDLPLQTLIDFHQRENRWVTMTTVKPPGRFGSVRLEGNRIARFEEKPEGDGGWINGGFFVMEPTVFDYLSGDNTILEGGPLEDLAHMGQLSAYKHHGFWQPMDTLRDKAKLQDLWESGRPPWKLWQDQ